MMYVVGDIRNIHKIVMWLIWSLYLQVCHSLLFPISLKTYSFSSQILRLLSQKDLPVLGEASLTFAFVISCVSASFPHLTVSSLRAETDSHTVVLPAYSREREMLNKYFQ